MCCFIMKVFLTFRSHSIKYFQYFSYYYMWCMRNLRHLTGIWVRGSLFKRKKLLRWWKKLILGNKSLDNKGGKSRLQVTLFTAPHTHLPPLPAPQVTTVFNLESDSGLEQQSPFFQMVTPGLQQKHNQGRWVSDFQMSGYLRKKQKTHYNCFSLGPYFGGCPDGPMGKESSHFFFF